MKYAFEQARRNTRAEKRRILAKPKPAPMPRLSEAEVLELELFEVQRSLRDGHKDAGGLVCNQARPNSKLCRPSYGADREQLFSKTPHGVKSRELVKVEARADADWLAHQRAEQQAMAQRLILESWACAFLFPPRSHFL